MTRQSPLFLALIASAAVLSTCTGKDDDDDDDDVSDEPDTGYVNGCDAGDCDDYGDDSDSLVPHGTNVWGFMYIGDDTREVFGDWSIAGTTVECSGCDLAFDGDFTAGSGGVSNASLVVTIDGGYVYTDAGDYWGAAQFYADYEIVVWQNYSSVVYYGASYYYYGYAYFY